MTSDQPGCILSIYNQKGGIAKTTTSVNLAMCLAAHGRSVLLVDLDAQGNATRSLGYEGSPLRSLQDLLSGTGTAEEAIGPTRFERVSLLPSSVSLANIETRLGSELRSQKSISELIYNSELSYDFLIFDCPPAFGLLSANALTASHSVLIPVTPTAFAYDGLQRTFDVVQKIQAGLNRNLRLDGILLTMMENDNISRHFANLLRKEYRSHVFDLEIPRDREIVKAALRRLPVCAFNPHALSSQNYLSVTEEFLSRRRARAAAAALPATQEIVLTHDKALDTLERFRNETATLAQARPAGATGAAPDDAPAVHAIRPLPPALKLGMSHLAVAVAGVVLGAMLGPRLLDIASHAAALLH
ncbi:MAG: ParA family protein [Proteobacteria bacterium]|nr:ParA family protein [Pseudomonadota bacterium]